jgi:poly-gamma-glutamate synthesis protein (capsule biosynthesis protein)
VLYTGAGDTKALAQTPTIIEKAGMKIGFLGFSDVGPIWLAAKEDSSGILLVNDDEFTESITHAKSLVDYLIVSIHWGEEYKTVHNAHQEAIAHKVIDAGADLLAGHHPHVAQDIEEYKNGLIIYSLGNYVFDQSFSTNTMKGLNVLVTLEENVRKEYALYESHLNSKYQIESVNLLAP